MPGVTDEWSVNLSFIKLTLTDDYSDKFLNEGPGQTVYYFSLSLV